MEVRIPEHHFSLLTFILGVWKHSPVDHWHFKGRSWLWAQRAFTLPDWRLREAIGRLLVLRWQGHIRFPLFFLHLSLLLLFQSVFEGVFVGLNLNLLYIKNLLELILELWGRTWAEYWLTRLFWRWQAQVWVQVASRRTLRKLYWV